MIITKYSSLEKNFGPFIDLQFIIIFHFCWSCSWVDWSCTQLPEIT